MYARTHGQSKRWPIEGPSRWDAAHDTHAGFDGWLLDQPVPRARDLRYRADERPVASHRALVDLVLGVESLPLRGVRRDEMRSGPLRTHWTRILSRDLDANDETFGRMGRSLRAIARALALRIRKLRDRLRVRRETRAVFRVLHGLDDRTLRDLGFHRCEIWSVAAEASGEAESTRMRTMLHPRAPR